MSVVDFNITEEKAPLNHSVEKGENIRCLGCFSSSNSVKKIRVGVCWLLVELCERFTFFEVVCNVIPFCTAQLGHHSHQAAILNLCFIGTSTLSPVFAGWFADVCLGRSKLVYSCLFLHFLGTALLSAVAFPLGDVYTAGGHVPRSRPAEARAGLFHAALLAMGLGAGGVRAIACPPGACSLQERGPQKPMSCLNRFYWLMNLNATAVFLGISYIQHSGAWVLVLLIPFMSALMALITLHMMHCNVIYQPEKCCSLLTVFGVFASALRACCLQYCHLRGDLTSWLDHAKEKNGGCYSELHVEDTKCFCTLVPLFIWQLLYKMCIMQIPSGYYLQTMNSNLNLDGFLLPIAVMNVISMLPLLILAPCMEYFSTWLFPSKRDGPFLLACIRGYLLVFLTWPFLCACTDLVSFLLLLRAPVILKLGPTLMSSFNLNYFFEGPISAVAGHLSAALSVTAAGFFEMHRKHFPPVEQPLAGKVLTVSSMPCSHLVLQYLLLGVAEALVNPAFSIISYRFVPSTIRGTLMNFLTLFNGLACFTGALLVELVYLISQGNWFPNTLNKGDLESFFFFLASLTLLNALGFWSISQRYCNLNHFNVQNISGSHLEETLLLHEKSLKFYGSTQEFSSSIDLWETAL